MGRFDQARENIRRAYEAGRATVRAAHAPAPEVEDELPEVDNNHVHVEHTSTASRDDAQVSRPLRLAAAWSWRLIVVIAAASVILWALARLHSVIIPLAIAMLLSALLFPAVAWLRRRGVHRSLATALVLIGGVLLVAGTLTLVVTEFVNNYSNLAKSASTGLNKIQDWLKGGLFHLSDQQLSSLVNAAQKWLTDHQSSLTTGALATATTAVDVVVSIFLVLFTTFFFLRDGDKIWRFLVNLLPRQARQPIGAAGQASWLTLVAYVRATVLVAFIDAVGIGVWLAVWRVELAFALAALVFLGAFIPIIGATLSGTVAVLIALVTRGPITALIILAGVIGVQQLEGHILQPLIMGRAVSIHPLAVILAIASGLVLAGIIGALVAVPIVAVLNTGIRHLAAHRRHEPDPPPPEAVVVGE
ncbi:MAG TPA: AI-2E family transporter [Micromonosporaceae bacterium]